MNVEQFQWKATRIHSCHSYVGLQKGVCSYGSTAARDFEAQTLKELENSVELWNAKNGFSISVKLFGAPNSYH